MALVAVPLAALVALWIFATTLTVGPALNLLNARTLLDEVGRPGDALVAELQRERHASLVYMAGGGDVAALGEQRTRTDQAAAEFRRRASSVRGDAPRLLNSRLDQMFTTLDILPSGRGFVDRREVDPSGALGLYSSIIDAAFRTFSAVGAVPDEELARESRTLTALGRAREVLGQSDALLAGVFAGGRFGPKEGEYSQLVQIIGTQRFLYAAAVAELNEADRVAYQKLTEDEAFVRLRQMEDEVVAKGRTDAPAPIVAATWHSSYDSAQQRLRDFELARADDLARRAKPVAVGILVRLGIAGVLGLVAVVLSVLISLRVGRSLIHRLTRLRAAALEMAGERLPSVVGRLRRGEQVDVAAETPRLEYGDDEIGQVGHAFSEVQERAVRSAVDEATLRRGLNDVFLNIARRSQTLLHRQLALLDRMERRATDPEDLENLFRIDHMATRMRRHSEDLVILAGASPGRGWRNPVPMVDVIRGAVSEVEDYARVDIHPVQQASVIGRAVGDMSHLLAELIENATAFSPPHTRVQVSGQLVPNGYAVEVEDRGLGMTQEAIDEANRRLADPPDFDPANSARLGLFVVAQLGARHRVKVQLRSSPYGGVTAIALLPTELVASPAGTLALSGRPASLAELDGGKIGWAGRSGEPPAVAAAVEGEIGVNHPRDVRPAHPIPSARTPQAAPAGSERRITTAMRLNGLGAQAPGRWSPAAPAESGRPSTPDPALPPPLTAAPAPVSGTIAGFGDDPVGASTTYGGPPGPARMADPPLSSGAPSASRPIGSPRHRADSRSAVPPAAVGEDGLPRRIRQSSLAPQLRRTGRDDTSAAQPQESAPPSPDEVRARMSALQAGTVRGRQDATLRLPVDVVGPWGTAAAPPGAVVGGRERSATPTPTGTPPLRTATPTGTPSPGMGPSRPGSPGTEMPTGTATSSGTPTHPAPRGVREKSPGPADPGSAAVGDRSAPAAGEQDTSASASDVSSIGNGESADSGTEAQP